MAAGSVKRRRQPEFRRLRRSELGLLAVPVLFGLAMPVLWLVPVWLTAAAVGAAVLAGFGVVFLPRVPQLVGWLVLGFGGALAWGVPEPALALCWLMLFPSTASVGSHVRAVAAGRQRKGR